MPMTRTLLAMRTEIRQMADMVGSTFVTDAEITSRINRHIAKLYNILASNGNADYYTKSDTSLSSVAGQSAYNLPSDFMSLAALFVQLGTTWKPVYRAAWYQWGPSRNTTILPVFQTSISARVVQNTLLFSPPPTNTGHAIQVWYTPTPPTLSGDSDTFDGVAGWEDYILHGVAADLLAKEESDPKYHLQQAASCRADIERFSSQRDLNRQGEVVNVDPWLCSFPVFGPIGIAVGPSGSTAEW